MMRHIIALVTIALLSCSAFCADAWKETAVQKNHNGTYTITHNGHPYNVCAKDADPLGLFNIDEVSEFWELLSEDDPRRQFEPEPSKPEPPSLDEAKAAKKAEIDANTNRIRDRDGLSYKGERFAMNDGAMLKWTGLMSARDILPYPMTILTMDDKPFVFSTQADLMQFLVAVLAYETDPLSPLSTGRALRQKVEAAESIDDVYAVVDERE